MSTPTDIVKILRRTEVLESLYGLQRAIDRRDWDTIATTFAPDAEGYGARGVEAIVATMQAHLGGVGPTQHLLGNSVVRLDDAATRATIRSYARVYHVGAGDKAGSFFECMGDYTDRWALVDEQWRLTFRHFEMRIMLGDFSVLQPGPQQLTPVR